jgi:ankyrin repeat protein
MEARDKHGFVPLHLAATVGETSVVGVLLRAGADENTRDKGGRTPLHWAAFYGHVPVVELLVRAGADKNAQDSDRRTPLHWAAIENHTAVAELLVQAGTLMEPKDRQGRTPFACALFRMQEEGGGGGVMGAIAGAKAVLELDWPINPATRTSKSRDENLRSWERSGVPKKWVGDLGGQWTHSNYLDLLTSLRRSEFWPMNLPEIWALLVTFRNDLNQAKKDTDPGCPRSRF